MISPTSPRVLTDALWLDSREIASRQDMMRLVEMAEEQGYEVVHVCWGSEQHTRSKCACDPVEFSAPFLPDVYLHNFVH